MSNNQKVLVVGPFTATAGGVVTFQRNLILHSDLQERWKFHQFNISRPAKPNVADNHNYSTLFRSGKRRLLKGVAITGWNFLRYPYAVKDAEVVQIQSSDFYSFWEASLYTLLSKSLGKPVVVRFGGSFNIFYEQSSPQTQRLIRWFLSRPDQIVVQSQGWKDFFSQLTSAERLNIVPNAVPPPPPVPQRQSNPREAKALFICTADAKRKGVDTVLAAAPRLRGKVRFIFVATPETVRQQIKQLGLEDMIEVHGTVARQEMKEKFYPEADIFLIPSHSEGFPNSMLEAMAAALPVVGSPAGAVPEVIEQGTHGFLNPATDHEGLARDVLQLVDNPTLRHQMGDNNYKLICDVYELNKVFARFDRIWKKAMTP